MLKNVFVFLTFKVLGRKPKCIAVQWRGMTLPISLWLPDSLSLSFKVQKALSVQTRNLLSFSTEIKVFKSKEFAKQKRIFQSFIFKTLLRIGSIPLLQFEVNVNKEKPRKEANIFWLLPLNNDHLSTKFINLISYLQIKSTWHFVGYQRLLIMRHIRVHISIFSSKCLFIKGLTRWLKTRSIWPTSNFNKHGKKNLRTSLSFFTGVSWSDKEKVT